MTRVVVRAVLLVALLLLGANELTRPHSSSIGQLRADLAAGRVTTMLIERPAAGDHVQGTFAVRWDTGPFGSYAEYEYRSADGAELTAIDEAARLTGIARSGGVEVTIVPPLEGFVDAGGWLDREFGARLSILVLLSAGGALVVLITGPQPSFATRWAWFWLASAIPVLWLVFLLLEPRPLWHSARLARAGQEPIPLLGQRERRLTGGWAFLIAWFTSAVLASAGLPVLSGWHPVTP